MNHLLPVAFVFFVISVAAGQAAESCYKLANQAELDKGKIPLDAYANISQSNLPAPDFHHVHSAGSVPIASIMDKSGKRYLLKDWSVLYKGRASDMFYIIATDQDNASENDLANQKMELYSAAFEPTNGGCTPQMTPSEKTFDSLEIYACDLNNDHYGDLNLKITEISCRDNKTKSVSYKAVVTQQHGFAIK